MGRAHLEGAKGRFVLVPDKHQVVLGRDPECDIVINKPDVSARHAMLIKLGAEWAIADMGSKNGTRVNGISVSGRADLAGRATSGRDLIELGSAPFLFWPDSNPRSANGLSDTALPTNGKPLTNPQPMPLLDRLLKLKPFEFEKLIGKLFQQLGFQAAVTKQAGDDGIDVEAEYLAKNTGQLVFQGKYLIQCKRYGVKHKWGALRLLSSKAPSTSCRAPEEYSLLLRRLPRAPKKRSNIGHQLNQR